MPGTSLKLSDFKTPEAPVRISRLVSFFERETTEQQRAEAIKRGTKEPATSQFIIGLEPLNWRAYNNESPTEVRINAKLTNQSPLFMTIVSLNTVLGIEIDGPEDVEQYFGQAFEHQDTVMPGFRTRPGERALTYFKFLRRVDDDEVAALVLPPITSSTPAQTPPPAEEDVDPEEMILDLLNEGSATKAELASRFNASQYKGNASLNSAIVKGTVLKRLVTDGRVRDDNGRFWVA